MHRDSLESALVSNLKIAIVSPRQKTRTALSLALAGAGRDPAFTLVDGGVEQAWRVIEQEEPDVLLIEGREHDESELLAIQPIALSRPGMSVVLLSPNQSPEYLRLGMRAGLREILPPDMDRTTLMEALGGVHQRLAALSRPRSQVLGFLGCKGGTGTTFIAANLAVALAGRGRRIALIDMNLQFGDAALHVSDRQPGRTLADVAREISRLDAAFLTSSMLHVLPDLDILAAPEDPEQALEIRAEHMEGIIAAAAAHYDLVLVDMGRQINEAVVRVIDRSDAVYCVLQQGLSHMRGAQRLMRTLDGLGCGRDKVKLVVNRHHRNGLLDPQRMAATLRHEVAGVIPDSTTAVDDSINQGISLLKLAPRDAVSRALYAMADQLCPAERTATDGWLKSLIRRH